MHKQPLHLRILFHPQSDLGRQVAHGLMDRFVEPIASTGLRVPTFFGPDNGDSMPPPSQGPQSVDLDVAEHSIVVVLADSTMVAQVVDGDTGDAWRDCAKSLSEAVQAASGRHAFFAVAIDEDGFDISDIRNVLRANSDAIEENVAVVSMEIARIAIILLREDRLNEEDSRGLKAPVQLFLSHAKADYKTIYLDSELIEKPETRWIIEELEESPIDHWFDSAQIEPNESFSTKIENGVRDCAIVIAVLTDQYASRPWCRREVLEAKRIGHPMLVVDALKKGEPRSFPYLGNVPTLRWEQASNERENRLQARIVIDRTLREALRVQLNSAITESAVLGTEYALATTPELIGLANDPCHNYLDEHGENAEFIYPDPPLSSEELAVIQRVYPSVNFTTPLGRIARSPLPESVRHVAVSISPVADEELRQHGLSKLHFQIMSDELHLYLLLAGAQIGYGGALNGDMTKDQNFTLQLVELVRGFSPLAKDALSTDIFPIQNYAPWPLSQAYTKKDTDVLNNAAKVSLGERPNAVEEFDVVFPERDDDAWRLTSDTASKRFAWGLGLSAMRLQMTDACAARVISGGRISGSQSASPGVLEEAWMSIFHGKPLFLVGAFGGMAGAVADLLEGRTREEFTEYFAKGNVKNYDEVVALYKSRGIEFISASRMMDDIVASGRKGIAASLNNGLTDEENQELFRVADPKLAAQLIIEGLRRIDQSDTG